jgi:TPR repeat protein
MTRNISVKSLWLIFCTSFISLPSPSRAQADFESQRGFNSPSINSLMASSGASNPGELLEATLPLAQNGDLYAQLIVGSIYENGLSPAHGKQDAIAMYLLASENPALAEEIDVDNFQTNLCSLYMREKQELEAMKWCTLAAPNGNWLAMHIIGTLYKTRDGDFKDLVLAYAWYDRAYAFGGGDYSLESRDDVFQKLSTEDVATLNDRMEACVASEYLDCE